VLNGAFEPGGHTDYDVKISYLCSHQSLQVCSDFYFDLVERSRSSHQSLDIYKAGREGPKKRYLLQYKMRLENGGFIEMLLFRSLGLI
jgi:hypothetical protein